MDGHFVCMCVKCTMCLQFPKRPEGGSGLRPGETYLQDFTGVASDCLETQPHSKPLNPLDLTIFLCIFCDVL